MHCCSSFLNPRWYSFFVACSIIVAVFFFGVDLPSLVLWHCCMSSVVFSFSVVSRTFLLHSFFGICFILGKSVGKLYFVRVSIIALYHPRFISSNVSRVCLVQCVLALLRILCR